MSTTITSIPIWWIWWIVRYRCFKGSLPSYGMTAAIGIYFEVFLIGMGEYYVRFCNPYSESKLYHLIVCIDKGWGEPGCRRYDGTIERDWGEVFTIPANSCYVAGPFYPNEVLAALTSEGMWGYIRDYVHVRILDRNGNELVTCTSVYINNPCYLRLVNAVRTYTTLDVKAL